MSFIRFAPQAQEEKDLADCLNFNAPAPEEEVEEDEPHISREHDGGENEIFENDSVLGHTNLNRQMTGESLTLIH